MGFRRKHVLCNSSVFLCLYGVQSLGNAALSDRVTYGALSGKLKGAAETTKGIEDIVGSVRGFLKAQ